MPVWSVLLVCSVWQWWLTCSPVAVHPLRTGLTFISRCQVGQPSKGARQTGKLVISYRALWTVVTWCVDRFQLHCNYTFFTFSFFLCFSLIKSGFWRPINFVQSPQDDPQRLIQHHEVMALQMQPFFGGHWDLLYHIALYFYSELYISLYSFLYWYTLHCILHCTVLYEPVSII